jgi:hypothetical protein
VSGGAYFRLYPPALYRRLVARAIARRGSYMMYLHSWEFDPRQPRVRGAGPGLTFRHYFNQSRTLPRMRRLVASLKRLDVSFMTARELVDGLPG